MTCLGIVKYTGAHFSWYVRYDFRAKIEPPSCRQYKPVAILALRPLIWDGMINAADDHENWVDPRAPSSGSSRPSNSNDNDDIEGDENTQASENVTGKGKGTKDRKGTGKEKATEEGKGQGKGNGKGKGIVIQTPGGDDICCAVALQLQEEMYEAASDTEGYIERVYFDPEASPAMSIS
jgi:hypothetical protein